MKLYDIYRNRETNNLIQIDNFARHMNTSENMIVVFTNIERHNDFEIGSCPSFNGYGTTDEIEKDYELLVTQEDLNKYEGWEEIFKLIK